jgi:hypothetical protein
MAGSVNVNVVNVLNGDTITTSATPPYFQVQVSWDNPKNINGTVTLTGTNGVTITPAAGFEATAMDKGTVSFSLTAASSVTGVTLTAKIDVPTNPPSSKSDPRTNITVTVT